MDCAKGLMMNTVIYTHDFQPITVIDIPLFLLETFHFRKHFQIPIYKEAAFVSRCNTVDRISVYESVELTCELFIRNGNKTYMVFTKNEEGALLLSSIFLPGQQKALSHEKDKSLIEGFIKAIETLKD